MSQPGRPTSSGRSLAPLAFMSLNFTPDFVPCWKLPKLLFCSVLPDVIVTANPAAASAGWSVFATPLQIVLPDGLDCVHVRSEERRAGNWRGSKGRPCGAERDRGGNRKGE